MPNVLSYSCFRRRFPGVHSSLWKAAGMGFGNSTKSCFSDEPPIARRRPKPLRQRRKPVLTIGQVLLWADAHHDRTGTWPNASSGSIVDAPRETWQAIDSALREGCRGFPVGANLTLARLLAEFQGVRNPKGLPPFSIEQILTWADAHYRRTGQWPIDSSGPIPEAPGETWSRVEAALRVGVRGLPGGSSLARILNTHHPSGRLRSIARLTPLRKKKILAWADLHFRRTSKWPTTTAGTVVDAPTETWSGINASLCRGLRGLPGGSSLARFLAQHRRKRNHLDAPRLTVKQILTWADAYRARTGCWPRRDSGVVRPGATETWCAVNMALKQGGRGLACGGSLARLLCIYRGVPNPKFRPKGHRRRAIRSRYERLGMRGTAQLGRRPPSASR